MREVFGRAAPLQPFPGFYFRFNFRVLPWIPWLKILFFTVTPDTNNSRTRCAPTAFLISFGFSVFFRGKGFFPYSLRTTSSRTLQAR